MVCFLLKRKMASSRLFHWNGFLKLLNATDEEREDWTQTDKGIHFNKLDLDVDVSY